MAKDRFKSRTSFILACVGAAVGLGDSLRFPGLCAKYGGGSFMLIYIIALIVIGIPVLTNSKSLETLIEMLHILSHQGNENQNNP